MNEFLDFGALRRMMVDTIILHARMTARLSAVLARLASKVYSVEIIEKLALSVRRRLAEQERDNVEVKVGDGSVSGGRITFPSTGSSPPLPGLSRLHCLLSLHPAAAW